MERRTKRPQRDGYSHRWSGEHLSLSLSRSVSVHVTPPQRGFYRHSRYWAAGYRISL